MILINPGHLNQYLDSKGLPMEGAVQAKQSLFENWGYRIRTIPK